MKRRTFMRCISFCLAGLLVAVGLWICEINKSKSYKLRIQNQYSSALSEFNSGVNGIYNVLQKAEYISSPQKISSYSAELYSLAELSKGAMSRLPDGGRKLETAYKFLSQVGNFALSLSKSVISGAEISNEQQEILVSLKETSKILSRAVTDTQLNFDNAENWAEEISALTENSVSETALAASLTETEENLADYPTLIYDGPYSDHILNKKPIMLENAKTVDQNSAQQTAEKLCGEKLEFSEIIDNKFNSYIFKNKTFTVAITKAGGYPLYMRKQCSVGDTVLSYDQALSKAKIFMFSNGYRNMMDTYYYTDEGVCVINFAFLDGQTVCYTDLIKVGVAMDNGEIVFFESSGYITNHTQRAFETPAYTANQAAERISNRLTVEASSVALIPTDSAGEVRCYEFVCRNEEGQEVLVYINVTTLEDEQVFILLETDGGTLVR